MTDPAALKIILLSSIAWSEDIGDARAAGVEQVVHKPIRRDDGLIVDYETTGDFPKFGNNDPRVDDIAADLVKRFMSASTKAVEAAERDPKGAAQAILDANPKGGKLETLTQGFELTIPLYRTAAMRVIAHGVR